MTATAGWRHCINPADLNYLAVQMEKALRGSIGVFVLLGSEEVPSPALHLVVVEWEGRTRQRRLSAIK